MPKRYLAPWQLAIEKRRKEAPKPTRASISIQGDIAEYSFVDPQKIPIPEKRGNIMDFSPRARLTMLKYFSRIDFTNHVPPLFMTLTYPDECFGISHADQNFHRKMMARHLEKLTGRRVPAAWRIEWVPRLTGMHPGYPFPHWHFLIFGHEYIDHQDVNRLWKKTITALDYVRTEIKRAEKNTCVSMYMAKYISKEAVPLSLVIATYQRKLGRQYGWLRKKDIPLHPEHRVEGLSAPARAAMMALAGERLPWVNEGLESSFTLFGQDASDAREICYGHECERLASADAVAEMAQGEQGLGGRIDQ